MSNYNLKIALTKLPGAKVMDIQGKTQTRKCVCIPIDDETGVVQESYMGKGKDGLPERKYLNEVQLNMTAFEFKDQKFGHSHGLKIAYNGETLQRMSEQDLRNVPIIGNLTPWQVKTVKKDDDDLPPATEQDW